MAEVWLALGSNIGRREGNLRRALAALARAVTITAVSSLYETEPVGYKPQGWFLNAVCGGVTRLGPRALLQFVKGVEAQLGRVETVHWGPRVVDIDILLYGGLVVDEGEALQIPHPRLAERAFVLRPLSEVAPAVVHPVLGATIADLARRLAGDEKVVLWKQRTGSIDKPWSTSRASRTTSA